MFQADELLFQYIRVEHDVVRKIRRNPQPVHVCRWVVFEWKSFAGPLKRFFYADARDISHFSGVKISELTISLFCIDTVIIAVQIVPVCYVSYVVHANPIQITDGLFVYALLMLLLGWSGFFFGKLKSTRTIYSFNTN